MNPLERLGSGMIARLMTAFCGGSLPVLIYHQVLAKKDPLRPDVPDAAEFQWQMAMLQAHFNPLPMAEAVQRLQQGTLPPKSIGVTFDDGYRDNLEVALPILIASGVPATVFVATRFCGGENMWNDRVIDLVAALPDGPADFTELGVGVLDLGSPTQRCKAYEALLGALKYLHYDQRLERVSALYARFGIPEAPAKMMSPDQLRQLAEAGVEIGAHTVDHPILKVLEPEEQRRQIADSKQTLEAIIGKPVTGFAYPNGKPGVDYDQTAVGHLKELGFDYAVSTTWGTNTAKQSIYELKRFTPWEKQPLTFQRRLLWNGLTARFG